MRPLPKRELLFDVDPPTPEPEPKAKWMPVPPGEVTIRKGEALSWSSLEQVPPGTVVGVWRFGEPDPSFLYVTTRGRGWWVGQPVDYGKGPFPEVFVVEDRGTGWDLSVHRGLAGPFIQAWRWPG